MTDQSFIGILGDGRLSLSALAPAVCECTDMSVFIIARTPSLSGIDLCRLNNLSGMDYPILYADENYQSFSLFFNRMNELHIRVGIIPLQSRLFPQLIEKLNGGMLFSACRDGLTDTYMPILERYITLPTNIFVFDNDTEISKKAQNKCCNPDIFFHQCIAHSVCSSIDYNYERHTIYLTSGKECLLVFPPEANAMQEYFTYDPVNGRSEIKFTESDIAYKFYSVWKPVGINVLHTLASVKAYVAGGNKGLSLSEISGMPFSAFVPETQMMEAVLNVYSILYDKYLAPYEEYMAITKDLMAIHTVRFIQGLYSRQENIGRGLSPEHSSFDSKVNRHFPLLKNTEDPKIIQLLNDFFNML